MVRSISCNRRLTRPPRRLAPHLGGVETFGSCARMRDMRGPIPFRLMFVCTGNICRSPMAEIVTRSLAAEARLGGRLVATSAGTGDWHVGESADARTIAALARAGYDGSQHRARQFEQSDFEKHDLIVFFDHTHERVLAGMAPDDAARVKLQSIVAFDSAPGDGGEIPDPYYAGDEVFDHVLEVIEQLCRMIVRQLTPALQTV